MMPQTMTAGRPLDIADLVIAPDEDRSATVCEVGKRRYRVTTSGKCYIVRGTLAKAHRLCVYLGLEPVTVL